MLIEIALTHPCTETVYWSAGNYYSRRSRPDSRRRRPIRSCPKCRESLGTPFVRAEAVDSGHRRLARAS
ncbi:MAG: hypothetical protein ACRD2W_23725 [Acidimicrobiales bacterium]